MAWRDGKPQCLFQAKSFADWHECKESKCPLINSKPKEQIDEQLEGQMNIEDFLGGD